MGSLFLCQFPKSPEEGLFQRYKIQSFPSLQSLALAGCDSTEAVF